MVFLIIEGKHNYNNCYSNESTASADTSVEVPTLQNIKLRIALMACRQNPEQSPKSQGNSKSAWVMIDHDCSSIRLMEASAALLWNSMTIQYRNLTSDSKAMYLPDCCCWSLNVIFVHMSPVTEDDSPNSVGEIIELLHKDNNECYESTSITIYTQNVI